MPTLPTFQALYDAAKAEIQLRRAALTDFNEGSALDAIAGAAAMLADEVIRVNVDHFAALFVDTATDDELDTLLLDRLGLPRKAATAAYGTVTWTKGSSALAYTIPAGTVLQATVSGVSTTVSTTSAVSTLAGEASVDLPCQATVAGRASNLAANTVTEIIDTVLVDPSATCTNAAAFAGGSDAETDPAYRDRARRFYGTLRRGTVEALETGALSVPGVQFVTVDESEVEESGVVFVYVGDPDARSNDTLASLVTTELENWRAAGVMVTVEGATREEVALTIGLRVERGADLDAVAAAVRAGIVAYGDTLSCNDPARLSRIMQAAHQASDLVIAALVTSHSTQIEPTESSNAIRFTEETIELSISEVS